MGSEIEDGAMERDAMGGADVDLVAAGRYLRGEGLALINSEPGDDDGWTEPVALGFRIEDVVQASTNVATILRMAQFDPDADDETLSARVGFTVEGGMLWADLTNRAKDARRDFEVSGAVLRAVLVDVGVRPYVLWHAHLDKVGPSSVDVANFPGWLCERGAVYTVRDGGTVMYGASVTVSDLSDRNVEASRHG